MAAMVAEVPVRKRCGTLAAVRAGSVDIVGLGPGVRVGDLVRIGDDPAMRGEIVALDRHVARAMTYGDCTGLRARAPVRLDPSIGLRPANAWQGRIIDAFGQPLDGRPLRSGDSTCALRAAPPAAAARRRLGARLGTGVAALDTMLPLVRGQRIGIFAGSGVGKSSLLAQIARGAAADRVIYALIGERGRELRAFVEDVLGPEGLAKSVIVAATSDESALVKRRAAWAAMALAEHFRDQGEHVLLLVDSLTRFADAHREIALTAGEPASLRGYPPSTGGLIAGLAERAGPGTGAQGDITAVFSVLVAGSDMEEPVADIARGVLDGHVVLDREIAERGRFPAIDVRRSVSRSLPAAATASENTLITAARRVLGTYEAAAPMIQSGLYKPGADADIDLAIKVWPMLDRFFGSDRRLGIEEAFAELRACLDAAQPQ
ncbi:MAG: FliI/YscN family ATPase [Pseudomonadota bacterium]